MRPLRLLLRGSLGVVALAATVVHAATFESVLTSYDVLQTVAGTATITKKAVNGWQTSMEGGLATAAELSRPHMAMADWQGNLYIADKDAHAIRKVTPDGVITTIAGTNTPGYSGDGKATSVELNQPNGLYTFPNGTTYILDLANSMIRKLSLDGQITTVLEDPLGIVLGRGLWVSPDEQTIFYSSGNEVRRWTDQDGITVYAGGFVALGNLTVDPSDGNIVATDRGGHAVYKVFTDGTRQRIAGNEATSGGGSGFPALSTGLKEVRGIQYHPDGGYFLATHDGGQIWFVDDDGIANVLIDGDDDGTHAGDGFPLTTPGRKISEPRAVTLAPNGDLIVTENDGGYIRLVSHLDPWKMGDFDQDRVLGESDIDRLSSVVRAGVHLQTLDLTFDGLVNADDHQVWVSELKNTYPGDANLDGEFNSGDLVQVFGRGHYQDEDVGNSGWGDGDWDGDGDFTSRDVIVALAAGGYDQGPRATVTASVPEPSSLIAWIVGVTAMFLTCRRGR